MDGFECAGLIKDIPSCHELAHRIVAAAAEIINKRLTRVASA